MRSLKITPTRLVSIPHDNIWGEKDGIANDDIESNFDTTSGHLDHVDEITSVKSIKTTLFSFQDPCFTHRYKAYMRNNASIWALIPIAAICLFFITTNSRLKVFHQNVFFWSSVVLLIVNFTAFGFLLIHRFRSFLYNGSLVKKVVEAIFDSRVGIFFEDIICVSCSALVGIVLIAGISPGDSQGEASSVLLLNSCPPGHQDCPLLLPFGHILLAYVTPILIQLCLRAVSLEFALISWLISTSFIIGSIFYVGIWQNFWLAVFSLLFFYISFEYDRCLKHCFSQTERLLLSMKRHNLTILKLDNVRENDRKKGMLETKTRRVKEALEYEGAQLTSLIANVAHDLKTPLQAIDMGTDDIQCRLKALQPLGSKLLKDSCKDSKTCLSFSAAYTKKNQANTDNLMFSSQERDEILESVSTISATLVFMLMIINRFIDFTKASHEIQLVPILETLDLEITMAWPLSVMRTLQGQISLKFEPLPLNLCRFVIADKGWLTENILCLLSNAIKYSNNGSVVVRCFLVPDRLNEKLTEEASKKVLVHGPDGFSLCVEVEDTGVGVSIEDRGNLFAPILQTQRAVAGGTGLGLYSLQKRMDALGGLCGVEDRYDGKEGSRFWFSFPYRPDEASAMQSQIELISSAVTMQRSASGSNLIGIGSIGSNIHLLDLFPRESSTQHTGRASFSRKYTDSSSKKGSLKSDKELFGASMKVEIIKGVDKDDSKLISVLLVDDSVPILKMCAKNLENSGFKVTLAKNGADALNILKERCRDFHVVLTDLQMPVMDGLECVKRFRKFECYNEFPITDHPGAKYEHRLPIIGMSANSCDETKNAALSSGMDHFIPKPFKLETFEEVLAQLCPQFVESRKLAILQALENIDEDDDNDDFGSVLSKILPLVPENLLSGIVPFLPVEILPTLIAQLPPSLLLVVIPSLPTNVILDLIPLLPEETALAVKARLPTGISSQINLPDLSIISEDEEDDANEILQPSVVPKSKKLSFCTTNSMCTLNTSVTSVEDGLSSSQPTFRKGSGLMNTPRGKKSMVMVELINNLSNETMCSVLPYLTIMISEKCGIK